MAGSSQLLVIEMLGGAPYGIRLIGGDVNPLTVAKIRPFSKASSSGLMEGDVILALNGICCKGLSHSVNTGVMESNEKLLRIHLLRGRNAAAEADSAVRSLGSDIRRLTEEEARADFINQTSWNDRSNNGTSQPQRIGDQGMNARNQGEASFQLLPPPSGGYKQMRALKEDSPSSPAAAGIFNSPSSSTDPHVPVGGVIPSYPTSSHGISLATSDPGQSFHNGSSGNPPGYYSRQEQTSTDDGKTVRTIEEVKTEKFGGTTVTKITKQEFSSFTSSGCPPISIVAVNDEGDAHRNQIPLGTASQKKVSWKLESGPPNEEEDKNERGWHTTTDIEKNTVWTIPPVLVQVNTIQPPGDSWRIEVPSQPQEKNWMVEEPVQPYLKNVGWKLEESQPQVKNWKLDDQASQLSQRANWKAEEPSLGYRVDVVRPTDNPRQQPIAEFEIQFDGDGSQWTGRTLTFDHPNSTQSAAEPDFHVRLGKEITFQPKLQSQFQTSFNQDPAQSRIYSEGRTSRKEEPQSHLNPPHRPAYNQEPKSHPDSGPRSAYIQKPQLHLNAGTRPVYNQESHTSFDTAPQIRHGEIEETDMMKPVSSQTKWPPTSKLPQQKGMTAKEESMYTHENANDREDYYKAAEGNWHPGTDVRFEKQGRNTDDWYPGPKPKDERQRTPSDDFYPGSKVSSEGQGPNRGASYQNPEVIGEGQESNRDGWHPGSVARGRCQEPTRDGWHPGSVVGRECHQPTEGIWYQGSEVKYQGNDSVEENWCDAPVARVKDAPQVALSRVYGSNTTGNERIVESHENRYQPPGSTYGNPRPPGHSYGNIHRQPDSPHENSHKLPEGTYGNTQPPPGSTHGNIHQTPGDTYGKIYQPPEDTYGNLHQPSGGSRYGNIHGPPESTYGNVRQPPVSTYGNIQQPHEDAYGKIHQPVGGNRYGNFHGPSESTHGNVHQLPEDTYGNIYKRPQLSDQNDFYGGQPQESFNHQPFSLVHQTKRTNATQNVWQPQFQNQQQQQQYGPGTWSQGDGNGPDQIPSYDNGYHNDNENDSYSSRQFAPPPPAPPIFPGMSTDRWTASGPVTPLVPQTAPPPPAPPIDPFKVYRGDSSLSLGRSALEEKVKLANSVANSVLSPENKNSRGQKMFLKKRENSAKWTKTSGGTSEGTPPPTERRNQIPANWTPSKQQQMSAETSSPAMKRPPFAPNSSVSYSSATLPRAQPTNMSLRNETIQSPQPTSSFAAKSPLNLADDLTRDGGKGGRLFAKKLMRTQSQDDVRLTTNPQPANPNQSVRSDANPLLSSSYRPIKFQSSVSNVSSPKVINRSFGVLPPPPRPLGSRPLQVNLGQGGHGYTDL